MTLCVHTYAGTPVAGYSGVVVAHSQVQSPIRKPSARLPWLSTKPLAGVMPASPAIVPLSSATWSAAATTMANASRERAHPS
jgi:hypothetical protein